MPDKVCRLSDFGSAFLHLNTGNGAIPLNLRPEVPPCIEFFCCMNFVLHVCCVNVLYACCIFHVVFSMLYEIVFI